MAKQNTDKMVLDLFHKVKEKQKEISSVEKPRWKTSCTIGYNPDSVNDRINIQTVSDNDKLLHLIVFLLQKQDYWSKANKLVELDLPLKWMGYTIDSWIDDIKSRIKMVNVTAKKKELELLEERLDKLISQEQRREMELAAIAEELK